MVEVAVQDVKDSDIRGSIFLDIVLKQTIQMQDELDMVNHNDDSRQNIKQHLLKDDLRFETILRNTEIEKLTAAMNKPHKRCNAIQSEKGAENTAFTRQEIKFSKVLTKHINLVHDELTYLGIEFDSTVRNHNKCEKRSHLLTYMAILHVT